MGLAGGLVKRVFSKHRSAACGRDCNVDKSRWSLSKLKFCGDDFDSVHAELNDFTSLECSDLTVTQHAAVASETSITLPSSESSWKDEEESDEETSVNINGQDNREVCNSEGKCLEEEYAAIVIQAAFRKFMERRKQGEMKEFEECQGMESPGRASLGTSVEVQVGDSVKNLPVCIQNHNKHKIQTRSTRMKEDWDDSTVSSNISKLRVQNRLEAMTRRERALAYAFSQQLRIGSNKKKQARHDLDEPNVGWNWLERWMAARHPECPLSENCSGKQIQSCIDHKPSILRKKINIDLEESCGSNDVPVSYENSVILSPDNLKDGYKDTKDRLKTPRDAKRRSNAPTNNCTAPSHKVIKSLREMEKEKQMQAKATGILHD